MSRSPSSKRRRPAVPAHVRVAELVRHAAQFSRAADQRSVLESHVVTVPRVKMSRPDLKLATIFVMPLGGKDSTDVVKALDNAAPSSARRIAHRVNC